MGCADNGERQRVDCAERATMTRHVLLVFDIVEPKRLDKWLAACI
jgi:hypothetical protein